jgi:hypothetical protein
VAEEPKLILSAAATLNAAVANMAAKINFFMCVAPVSHVLLYSPFPGVKKSCQ